MAERPHVQRVDPRRHPGPDRERLDAERAAQRLVLVLDVAGDQGAVAERHHPGAEALGRSRLPAARLGELEDVGVGGGDVVAQHPSERVAVERAAGELVDAHLRSRRGQGGCGDEGPEHRGLVAGHPPGQCRGAGGGPAAAAAGGTATRGVPEQPGLLGLRREGGDRGQVVPEVGQQGGHVAAAAAVAAGGGHQASPLRVRLVPRGMVDAANPTSWARSRRSGANPARRTEASSRRPNSVIRMVFGTVTVHTP